MSVLDKLTVWRDFLKSYQIWFQAITIKRSSSAQGGAGNYEVITIDDDDDVIPTDTKTADSRISRIMTAAHLESHSGSRTDYLARGGSGISQRDYLSRGGTQTLGGTVKIENVTALRSTPQWLTATTSSLASTPSVGITIKSPLPLLLHVKMLNVLQLFLNFHQFKSSEKLWLENLQGHEIDVNLTENRQQNIKKNRSGQWRHGAGQKMKANLQV